MYTYTLTCHKLNIYFSSDLLRPMFLIPCDYWKALFFHKNLSLLFCLFSNRFVATFFEISILNEVYILRYLHKNITNTKVPETVLNYAS